MILTDICTYLNLGHSYVCGGSDGFIPVERYGVAVEVPLLGNVTCLDVKRSAYFLGDFNDFNTCLDVKDKVYDACCTLPDSPYDSACDVCGFAGVSRDVIDDTLAFDLQRYTYIF